MGQTELDKLVADSKKFEEKRRIENEKK